MRTWDSDLCLLPNKWQQEAWCVWGCKISLCWLFCSQHKCWLICVWLLWNVTAFLAAVTQRFLWMNGGGEGISCVHQWLIARCISSQAHRMYHFLSFPIACCSLPQMLVSAWGTLSSTFMHVFRCIHMKQGCGQCEHQGPGLPGPLQHLPLLLCRHRHWIFFFS